MIFDSSCSVEPHQAEVMVIIATLNEMANLPSIVARIRRVLPASKILVIDDNSQDGTREWLATQSDHHLEWIIRTEELGLGTATLAGLKTAISRGFAWVATLDADGSHDPAVLKQMLDCDCQVDGRPVDLCIGSRYTPGGKTIGWPMSRWIGSKAVNFISRWLVGLKPRDTTSALRLYRIESLRQIDLEQLRNTGYGYLQEILWHLQRHGALIREFPITFVEREQGESKLRIGEALRVLAGLMRLTWWRFTWRK
jgi:dolichol-phosphate mannosyltransferase